MTLTITALRITTLSKRAPRTFNGTENFKIGIDYRWRHWKGITINGATTFSITALSITKYSIGIKNESLSIMALDTAKLSVFMLSAAYSECHLC